MKSTFCGALTAACFTAALLLKIGANSFAATNSTAGNVTQERLRRADRESGQWMSIGRDGNASFYSPLEQIDTKNAVRLGFAWQYKTNTYRGMEATPLVVDGVMYVPGIWGLVYALDVRDGRELWTFDPQIDRQWARWSSSDVTSRGVSVWHGRVYALSTDCRLFALDARNGHTLWSVHTLVESVPGYTCSGATHIVGDNVVVGNSGGDNLQGGVRGYVSAFNLNTGKLAWRFYTVPSLKDKNPSPELQQAAATWDPQRDSGWGGGGTVWGLITYDPDLDLLYFGTGNAAPYSAERDWSGGTSRDRLYAATILALRGKTGKLAWHYQTTPGDIWDFDANTNLILAQLLIGGKSRRVLMQANKNGYFYVLDRVTGEPLSIAPFAYLNWATGIGPDHRPIVAREADYRSAPKVVYPSASGAHSWPPMSYSPSTGLVYIPAIETGMIMADVRALPTSQLSDLEQSLGVATLLPDKSLAYEDWERMIGRLPRVTTNPVDARKPLVRGVLKAWDPLQQKVVWEQQTSQDYLVLDGGTLATAGGLVFAGREDGQLVVYDARTGAVLKSIQTHSAIMAAPMTYAVAGKQYVSVLCGHGGSYFTFLGTAAMNYINEGRILTFTLDGDGETPNPEPRGAPPPYRQPPPRSGSPELIAAGRNLFTAHCGRCHALGVPAISSDLSRMSRIGDVAAFNAVVLKGAFAPLGMPRFDDVLDAADTQAVYSYLIDQQWAAYKTQAAQEAGDR